jgi:hypothetical protein
MYVPIPHLQMVVISCTDFMCKDLFDIQSFFNSREFTNRQVDVTGVSADFVHRQLSANFTVVIMI